MILWIVDFVAVCFSDFRSICLLQVLKFCFIILWACVATVSHSIRQFFRGFQIFSILFLYIWKLDLIKSIFFLGNFQSVLSGNRWSLSFIWRLWTSIVWSRISYDKWMIAHVALLYRLVWFFNIFVKLQRTFQTYCWIARKLILITLLILKVHVFIFNFLQGVDLSTLHNQNFIWESQAG
jgi:hypothetical protein